MTLLIRGIVSVDRWLRFGEPTAAEQAVANPPIWAIREFIPKETEGEVLSLYEVGGEDEALIVAAAFAFNSKDFDKKRIVWAAAEKGGLQADGLEISCSKGRLCHELADARHREVRVATVSAAVRLAVNFIKGDVFSFEGKVIGTAARNYAREGQFIYSRLGKRDYPTNWAWKNVSQLVLEQVVSVRGVRGLGG
jgi:hypothetical protein